MQSYKLKKFVVSGGKKYRVIMEDRAGYLVELPDGSTRNLSRDQVSDIHFDDSNEPKTLGTLKV